MKHNYEVVKELLTKHIELGDLMWRLQEVDIDLPLLGRLNLSDIALDVIGFPMDADDARRSGRFKEDHNFSDMYCREKLIEESCLLTKEDVDAFIEKLYAEYNQLLLEQPHLFVAK